ncbi:lysophospholipid acyltransferase family protein [Catenuloplanes atrovinosus]|uniref:1-acyl-sn-glycerol-3-phosphate acyltransferase n=1 Tax=Catenuloplanes atrovinosus TaxID=137266 RepID=A0AAE4CBU9_9ACTN|nr:lysophospholipid acyltransferase family protein [Catenuloplanes atrovinosus]MDR7275940.1 1-acyl-sn-glycerol-3-phosphate acyltransferase [Catenuloplanes atrovinosus]
MTDTTPWTAPLVWRSLLLAARGVVGATARLRVTGEVPPALRRGPLILAANHISPVDPVVMMAACRTAGITPRIMATGGVFRTPVLGSVMRASGQIRVDRRTATVARALDDAATALREGSVVLIYPEGRIGLDPGLWPERGKTGAARLALTTGAPVVPVAQWGGHTLIPYDTARMADNARAVLRDLRHRPPVRVGFGAPVDLSGLTAHTPGDAQRATDRIIDAITATLATLRPDEPGRPHHHDPTRPADTSRAHRRG